MTQAVPDTEPYPSEVPKIKRALERLRQQFENQPFDDITTMDKFHRAAVELFGEAGFLVATVWEEARQNGQSCNLFIPTVTIAGRVDKESETDHERYRHEVVSGLADGIKGYVREDGTLREDPIKKSIL